ncbi:hypothetical protein A0H81_10959 [Grifola frondosa]|uniref:SH3 domain-containing protein n=1 Tax=Grifola frondosa TaxID=5627 RepID=A0A1C7LWZ1_GRIFR|nr:hypothetical protein A0H81_10959 [Grifola frondosa]
MAILRNMHTRQRAALHSPASTTALWARAESSAPPVANPLPTSVKALTAFFVILGVIVLGIVTWRVVVWRRRKVAASARFRSYPSNEKGAGQGVDLQSEKQEIVVILPTAPSASATRPYTREPAWVPQMRSMDEDDASTVVIVDSSRSQSVVPSPPPTYAVANGTASPPSNSPRSVPAPLNLPIVTVTDEGSTFKARAVSPAVPSPRRTSSFGLDTYKEPTGIAKRISSMKGNKLPRLMTVEHTFVPTLADELSIKIGETLRMLEEYEDEWCLVQRLADGEKGVVPRFCVRERPEIGAALAKHKRTPSSVVNAYHKQ